MKVRVKPDQKGFIYGSLRRGASAGQPDGDEFTIIPVEHSTEEKNGKPVVISPEEQFSDTWMEKIEQKAKPGPKPKPAEKQEAEEK